MERAIEEKIIFHIDVNSAFLSWESVERLKNGESDLREIASAVGGDMATRHGVILAKSIPAKKYHVRTGESIVEALRKCPGLVVVKPHHERYREYSRAFIRILQEYTPDIEQVSIDEAFMDMTGTRLLFGEPVDLAYRIKDRIKNELGFTVNVGISSNKLLAKMASDFEKPDKVHTLFPEEIKEKMWQLPVSDLFFVGKATAKKLNDLGIYKIGQIANADIHMLKMNLKKQGETIWNFANGIDFSVVQSEPTQNKEYGNSTTISFDVTEEATAKWILLSLSEKVAERLRRDGLKIASVSVTIKDHNFKSKSHQKMLDAQTNITSEIYHTACELFDELWDGTPIRLLGIQTSKIMEEDYGRQLSLFDHTDYEKMERLDEAVDKIRGKYGKEYIKRASFLKKIFFILW